MYTPAKNYSTTNNRIFFICVVLCLCVAVISSVNPLKVNASTTGSCEVNTEAIGGGQYSRSISCTYNYTGAVLSTATNVSGVGGAYPAPTPQMSTPPASYITTFCGNTNWTWVTTFVQNGGIQGNFTCNGALYIDIGLRVKEQGRTSPTAIAIETSLVSPLRIAKNGTIYSIALVDPSDPAATSIRIKIAGAIKALRKFVSSVVNFPDQSATALGHCNGSNTSFYATIPIASTYGVSSVFTRTSTTGSGSSPTTFTVSPNSTLSQSGFGNITYSDPGCNIAVPASGVTDGSATYSISQNGTVVDTATYSWNYPQ